QFVLEVLQHDRLAARLDAGAAGPRPLGRVLGAELLHLAASFVAACGAPRLRLPHRTRRPRQAVSTKSRSADWHPRRLRAQPFRPGRRGVLPLCRHLEPDPGRCRVLPPAPRRDRGGSDTRARLRSNRWRRLGPALVRRRDRGGGRGLPPSGELARSLNCEFSTHKIALLADYIEADRALMGLGNGGGASGAKFGPYNPAEKTPPAPPR